ncbi:hypothetical protein M5K25_025261 [Dendrobium thyrsiflorum]|uniref:Uncharacterized protein n=1 Tax=Dendrobium thyrsiflorum TaxID=117978 RepID=A0ABD0U3P1_DENTH
MALFLLKAEAPLLLSDPIRRDRTESLRLLLVSPVRLDQEELRTSLSPLRRSCLRDPAKPKAPFIASPSNPPPPFAEARSERPSRDASPLV